MDKKQSVDSDTLSMDQKYSEAGELLRHYSTIRATIISITVPLIFGMGALILSFDHNNPILFYLLFTEFILFVTVAYLSIFLAQHIFLLRACLRTMESGSQVNPYNTMENIHRVDLTKMDIFDRAFLILGIILHAGFYLYMLTTYL